MSTVISDAEAILLRKLEELRRYKKPTNVPMPTSITSSSVARLSVSGLNTEGARDRALQALQQQQQSSDIRTLQPPSRKPNRVWGKKPPPASETSVTASNQTTPTTAAAPAPFPRPPLPSYATSTTVSAPKPPVPSYAQRALSSSASAHGPGVASVKLDIPQHLMPGYRPPSSTTQRSASPAPAANNTIMEMDGADEVDYSLSDTDDADANYDLCLQLHYERSALTPSSATPASSSPSPAVSAGYVARSRSVSSSPPHPTLTMHTTRDSRSPYSDSRGLRGSRSRSRSHSRSRSRSPTQHRSKTGTAGRDADRRAAQRERDDNQRTLFVGDLPPYLDSKDLQEVFENLVPGQVSKARVMGCQCYGFVTFISALAAADVLDMARCKPITVHEYTLRVAQAQGQMPDWKRGPAIYHARGRSQGVEGLESYEHPRAREARLSHVASALVHSRSAAPRALPLAQYQTMAMAAAAAYMMDGRHMPDYGDL